MQYLIKTLEPHTGISTLLLEATDLADARRQAVARGHAVVSVSPAPLQMRLGKQRSVRFPLLLFSQELLALLQSGITIVEAIETLAEKEQQPGSRALLQKLLAGLREGQTFSATLENFTHAFPPLYIATIRASERTGDLDEALIRYIAYASRLEILKGKLVSAAIYPLLLLGVGGLVILFLMGYVVPRFSHIYQDMGGDLPFLSQLLLHWGIAIERYWPVVLAAIAVLAAVMLYGGNRGAMKYVASLLWRIPAIGERIRVFQLARLYRTLSMLLKGGIPVVQALGMVSGLLSPALQGSLRHAEARIREGAGLSQAFETNHLTTAVSLRMLRVGERTGNMGEMMERAATFHDEEMSRWAEWATRLFGPLLMLLMGLVIGAIVVLMYLPIFQLAESIG